MSPSPLLKLMTRAQVEALAGGAAALSCCADWVARGGTPDAQSKAELMRKDAAELCGLLGTKPPKPEVPPRRV